MMGDMNNTHTSIDRWREIIRKQSAGGFSIAAFCRREGVTQSAFYAWRRKLRDEATFVEVKFAPEPLDEAGVIKPPSDAGVFKPSSDAGAIKPPGDAGTLELRLPGRRCVVVRPGFDRRTLLDLLATLDVDGAGRGAEA
jgi:hypothetical protein